MTDLEFKHGRLHLLDIKDHLDDILHLDRQGALGVGGRGGRARLGLVVLLLQHRML